LVFHSSTITMMHGPINTSPSMPRSCLYLFTVFIMQWRRLYVL